MRRAPRSSSPNPFSINWRRGSPAILFCSAFFSALAFSTPAFALISDGLNALDLVGQFDETSFTNPVPVYTKYMPNNGANKFGFNTPSGIAIDIVNDKFYVTDTTNNRILVYSLNVNDTLADRVPDYVLGQPNFYSNAAATTINGINSPMSLAFSALGYRLFASDNANNRVVMYETAYSNNQNAVDLVGQYDETSFTNPVPVYTKGTIHNGPNKFGFSTVTYLAYDASNYRLFVSDQTNNRVLVYAMNSNGTFIDRVPDNILGQPNYSTAAGVTTQNGMFLPLGIAYDSGNNRLFVAEQSSARVTVYDVAAITDGENATNVLGEPNFTAASFATQQNGMGTPVGLAYDSANNRLFVADMNNNRVTTYDVTTITNGENAINVLGQPNFTRATASTTQSGMNVPYDVAYDSGNNRLFVAEGGVPRVTVYNVATITDGEMAMNVLGQPNFAASGTATTQNGMSNPRGITYDSGNNRLFVGDQSSARVTVYDVAAITDGENATNVLGAPNFLVGGGTTQQNGMVYAIGVAYDSGNNRLFVAQGLGNRITVYDVTAITDGENAVDLLGQYDETSFTDPVPVYIKSTANNGPNKFGFSGPTGVLVDQANNRLFVSDTTNNRVLVYALQSDHAFTDRVPDNVLGQPGYYTSASATTQNGLSGPRRLSYDNAGNRLFVPAGNRVLVYDVTTITDGENAVNVLGQPNFTASSGVAQQNGMLSAYGTLYDSGNNRLFVAEAGNNRVTVYDVASIADGENATNLIGQPNYLSSSTAVTQSRMYWPTSLAYDSANNRLFVADSINNRVTVFNIADIVNGEMAVNVIGQPNFTANAAATQQNSLAGPEGVAYDSVNSRLFVAESTNSRVTIYDASSISNGENATNVLGQPDYVSATASTQQNGMSAPSALEYDSAATRLYVSDTTNDRVIIHTVPILLTGMNAASVLGQPDFTTSTSAAAQNGMNAPQDLALSNASTTLFVAESGNNRVTFYDVSAITNGENATNVLGQPNYSASAAATTQNGMNTPKGIAYDSTSNRLFVAQSGNNRITFYDILSVTNGENATNVLGQTSFTAGTAATTQAGLRTPFDIAYGNNNLYVSDTGNSRIIVQALPVFSNGMNAEDAAGQFDETNISAPVPIYTTTRANNAPNRLGLSAPTYLAYDGSNYRLFLGDKNNNRVLVFAMNSNGTFVDRIPDNVLGQSNYYASTAATQQNGMNVPNGIAYDSANNRLFVAQQTANRVTVYDVAAITDGENATNVLGQPNFVRATAGTTQNGMNVPQGIDFDSANNRLFVGQSTANRVTVYDVAAITDGENATNVLGQPNFVRATAGTTQNGMNAPDGVSYGGTNNRLFVAQNNANRVTVYDIAAITNGENAINVLGQPNFTASTGANQQNAMSGPRGLAYDTANNRLFVAQSTSSRVTVYDLTGIVNGENATNVLGQPNYLSSTATTQQNGLNIAWGITYNSANNLLFVAQTTGNRVSVYDVAAITNGENATDLIGQYNETSYSSPIPIYTTARTNNAPNRVGFNAPTYLVYDTVGFRLFLTDKTNNRILVYAMNTDGSFVDRIPDNVLGQPDFYSITAATTQNGLNVPEGITYDSANNRLFVAQSTANRVTVYDVTAITNGENATNVLGEPDFVTPTAATTQNGMNVPSGVSYDSTNNRLFVAQSTANRVTVYDVTAITNGENATNVLGRPDFVTTTAATTQNGLSAPQGLSYDVAGNRLFVSDQTNRRVIVYDVAAITNGENATNVLGQPNFSASASATTQNGMINPTTTAYDSIGNRLFHVDGGGNRVLVYDIATITNGENATNVLGQAAFNTSTAQITQNGMQTPFGAAYDTLNSRLFVSDFSNNRILVYALSMPNGKAADAILGQPNFTSSVATVTQNGLNAPRGITLSGSTLFVTDSGNHRVLFYDVTAITNGENASNLLGQYDETSFTAPVPVYSDKWANNGPNKFGFSGSTMLSIDGTNHRMFFADSTNNRVLVYALATDNTFSDRVPDNVLGQPNYSTRTAATTQNGMSEPRGMNFDAANNRLFVAQGGSNRVAVYDVTMITDGENATNMLGQPNYTSSAAATTQNGMNTPRGVAYDSTNNRLFVADNQNNRVLAYDVAAITNGENATNVLGQTDFGTATAADTQAGMNGPQGLSYDSGRTKLFVAQNNDNRVTAYAVSSITNGQNATNILGQGNYTATASSNAQNGLNDPRGLAFDSFNNRLFVSNYGNNRITVFSTTTMINGQNADNILGQPNYAGTSTASTQNGLSGPVGLAFEGTNRRLFVTDSSNNRITIYDGSGSNITPAGGGGGPLPNNNHFFFFGF